MSEFRVNGVCAMQLIGRLSRVYSCLSPNERWYRHQPPPLTVIRSNIGKWERLS
uniref:Uncharacterized protein n=1 Tax=Anguilla anguilla TaxID=7936 RepID=A0A0E9UWU0_ANGAN